MRRAIALSLAIILLLAARPTRANSFPSFEQTVGVGADSTLTVRERVRVEFIEARHGIFRDLPVRYRTEAGNPFSLRVEVISVTRNGAPEPFTEERAGDRLRLRIGDPDAYVTGVQEYAIEYSVRRALLYFDDHDELYWNVVTEPWGDLGWPARVQSTVLITGVAADDLRTRCFIGIGVGAPEGCDTVRGQGSARFTAVGAPLTIVVGWPTGLVRAPSVLSRVGDWIADNWIVFLPVVVFAFLFRRWYRTGKEPERKGPLVVQYEPPAAAHPAELGVLFDQKADVRDVTATIVHLAVKGYLVIHEEDKRTYAFELTKGYDTDPTLTSYERDILNGLFTVAAPGEKVALSSLERKFHVTMKAARDDIEKACVERGWFTRRPSAVRAAYFGVGTVVLGILFWVLGGAVFSGPVSLASAVITVVCIFGFGYFMPSRTRAGADAYAEALGFREYLAKAEKYRLQWEEKERIFEKYLPFAMVFGVVDKWARAFEGLNLEPPDWYRGSGLHAFAPLYFANSLMSATSTMERSLATSPSSRSGGGFGGGGGGGGGFGGGGGGSW